VTTRHRYRRVHVALLLVPLALVLAGVAVARDPDADTVAASGPALFPATTAGLTSSTSAIVSRSSTGAPTTSCGTPGPKSYFWPVKPFDRPHPVRGDFGDPRTIIGSSWDPTAGTFSFHNGIDISAPAGTPAYPVVSGAVTAVSDDEITIETADRRTFLYFHLRPRVHEREHVWALRTVLGLVQAPYQHVHLSELRDDLVRNPLMPGHLTPYSDTTVPTVHAILFRGAAGRPLDPRALSGGVDLVAWADDRPELRPLGPWRNVPTAPALVTWELRRPSGRIVVPPQVVVDFERTEPPRAAFWDVYVPGTYQNFPVVGDQYEWGLSGRYLFDLTPDRLDTTELTPGVYLITVKAADTCGNVGSLTERIRIADHSPAQPVRERLGVAHWPTTFPLTTWPHRRRAWTLGISWLPEGEGLDAAVGRARDAHAAGLRHIGVLRSDVTANLPANFVLVFSGIYRTRAMAERALLATSVRTLFPDARPLLIKRPTHGDKSGFFRAL
jgi:hypothetical protein